MALVNNPYLRNRFGMKNHTNEDLYAGYESTASSADLIATTVSKLNNLGSSSAASSSNSSSSSSSSSSNASIRPPTGSTLVSAGEGSAPRPMTAVKAAGYSSASTNSNALNNKPFFDPFNQQATGPAPPLQRQSLDTPELQARDMEKTVNRLIEESAQANVAGDLVKALDKAKEAGKRERQLCRHREKNGLSDQMNFDLTYSVCFNLAHQYHANGMFGEALNTYAIVVRNKQYPAAGRLRVNMGNIYYQQRNYPNAIKMYRMAMDQIGQQSREMRFKIMRNIGNAFVRLGQFQDAIHMYENIMEQCPDAQSGFNLVLCYYALGDKDKMKKGFLQLLKAPDYKLDGDADAPEEEDGSGGGASGGAAAAALAAAAVRTAAAGGTTDPHADASSSVKSRVSLVEDELRRDRRERRKITHRYLYLAAKLIAPVIEKDMPSGYDWVIDALRNAKFNDEQDSHGADNANAPHNALDHRNLIGFPAISMELEIAKGIAFLKRRAIGEAIDVFKSFEKKDGGIIAQAATNLSFLYFLEADMKNAEKYADLAVKSDRYNAKALVNKANYLFVRGDFESAKELYLEAIGVEADCVEAIYNLGLTNKRLNNLNESLQAFKKLHRIVPRDAQVLWHIGSLYESGGDNQSALHWFNTLHNMVPSDPKVLARLGTIYTKEDDESAAFSNFSDSYNSYPVNMEVISWLGVWYVKSEYYEEAIQFFERAADIEPHELKWQLMVASCYRRMNATAQALALYKQIHRQDPDNIECIRYLCSLYKESNDTQYEEYSRLLRKAERAQATKDATRYAKGEMKEDADLNTQPNATTMRTSQQQQPNNNNSPSNSPSSSARGGGSRGAGGGSSNVRSGASVPDFDPSHIIPQKQQQPTINHGRQNDGDEWGDEGLPDELLPL